MLDDDHAGPRSNERVERVDQALDVGRVEAGARLVENEQRPVWSSVSARASFRRCASPPDSVESGWPSGR